MPIPRPVAANRALALAGVILAHLALALLVAPAPAGLVPARPGPATTMALIPAPAPAGLVPARPGPATTMALIPAPAPPPPAPLPPPTFVTVVALPAAPVIALAAPAPPPASTGPCAILVEVAAALATDPPAQAALAAAPPATRSVANAVVAWSGAWSPSAAGPLAPVRAAVERALARVSPACLDEPVIGPRLVPVVDARGAAGTMVVFGSGTWSWAEVRLTP